MDRQERERLFGVKGVRLFERGLIGVSDLVKQASRRLPLSQFMNAVEGN